MKNFIYLICVACLVSSCVSGRKSRNTKSAAAPVRASTTGSAGAASPMPTAPSSAKPAKISRRTAALSRKSFSPDIENSNPLQFKYSILMDEEVEVLTDRRLYTFIEDWYGTPYKYGGNSRSGVDCSGFAAMLLDSVFDTPIPRTCKEQSTAGKRIKKSELFPGDLVFFNTTGKISHVGVFLGNNKFVHAATSSGVMISDLDDVYFKKRYAASVRVR